MSENANNTPQFQRRMRDNDILKSCNSPDFVKRSTEDLEAMRRSKSELKKKIYDLEIKRGSEGYKAMVAKMRKELGL